VQAGEKTISVEVTSVVRASDRSFQVKWTETAYDRGSLVGSTRWTAMLSIDLKPRKAPMSCAGTRSGSTSMPSTGAGSLRARRIIPALRPPLPPALSRHRSPLCPANPMPDAGAALSLSRRTTHECSVILDQSAHRSCRSDCARQSSGAKGSAGPDRGTRSAFHREARRRTVDQADGCRARAGKAPMA
jgi:hypothetical protein